MMTFLRSQLEMGKMKSESKNSPYREYFFGLLLIMNGAMLLSTHQVLMTAIDFFVGGLLIIQGAVNAGMGCE